MVEAIRKHQQVIAVGAERASLPVMMLLLIARDTEARDVFAPISRKDADYWACRRSSAGAAHLPIVESHRCKDEIKIKGQVTPDDWTNHAKDFQ